MNLLASIYLIILAALGISTSLLMPLPLPRWLKIFIGPALGIVLITQLTLITSLIFGFQHNSIIVSLLLFLTIIASLIIKYRPQVPPVTFKRIRLFLASIWPLVLILSTVGMLVAYIFGTKILTPRDYGLITGGGGLYGDTALHSAYTTSLVEQGLPPKNPLFAGIPLVYPFLVNLFSAILVKLGTNLRFAFIIPHLIYFLGFVSLFYFIYRKFTSNLGTFFAMLIFFLGWGLGFTVYIDDSLKNHSLTILKEYTNNPPGFHMHNVLSGLIFPERSFLPGLFIGLLITLLALEWRHSGESDFAGRLQNPKKADPGQARMTPILIGILLGILPLWHTHTFLFFGISIGIWYLSQLNFSNFKSNKLILTHLFITYCIGILLALPVILWSRQQVSHDSFIRFTPGWMDSRTNPLLFWFKNTGLVIPLALMGLSALKKPLRIFFLPAFLIFLLANFIIFQPWDWDNIKLFSWVFLFLAILAGHTLTILSRPTPPLPLFLRGGWGALVLKSISVIILLSLTSSGLLSIIHQASQTHTIYDNSDLELADWVKTHTESAEVFLVDPWPNHPLPGLTGRSAYLGYPGHLWVHGIDYSEREALVKKVLAGDTDVLSQAEVPLNYLIIPRADILLFSKKDFLTQVFENQKFAIYKIL